MKLTSSVVVLRLPAAVGLKPTPERLQWTEPRSRWRTVPVQALWLRRASWGTSSQTRLRCGTAAVLERVLRRLEAFLYGLPWRQAHLS